MTFRRRLRTREPPRYASVPRDWCVDCVCAMRTCVTPRLVFAFSKRGMGWWKKSDRFPPPIFFFLFFFFLPLERGEKTFSFARVSRFLFDEQFPSPRRVALDYTLSRSIRRIPDPPRIRGIRGRARSSSLRGLRLTTIFVKVSLPPRPERNKFANKS